MQHGGKGAQAVEPALRWVNRLADVIGLRLIVQVGCQGFRRHDAAQQTCAAPESNPQSIVSGTRRISPPQFGVGQGQVTLSMKGR